MENTDWGPMELLPKDIVCQAIREGHGWDMWLDRLLRLRAHYEPKLVFVDVGAHVGFTSRLAVLAGYHVVAFEPQEELYRRLVRNVKYPGNVLTSALPLGCYSHHGWQWPAPQANQLTDLAGWDYSQMPSPGSVSFIPCRDYGRDSRACRFVPLDDVVGGQVDFLKVDAQGADLLVLEGAAQAIRRWKPWIVFEREPGLEKLHGVSGWEAYQSFFETLDYMVEPVPEDTSNFLARPR